jgi:hypothetical protein
MAGLSTPQRRFLEAYVRTDVDEERRAAYKEAHCEQADNPEEAIVTRFMNALLGRRDAQLYMAGARRRLEYETTRALQERDEAAFDVQKAGLAANRAAIELLTVQLSRADLKAAEAAKLIESAARYGVSATKDAKGMTSEQRKAAVARLTRTSQDANAPTQQTPVKETPIGIA